LPGISTAGIKNACYEKKPSHFEAAFIYGGEYRTRTDDLLHAMK